MVHGHSKNLRLLGKYLQAYTIIFKRNPRARYYSISYVDAFAGTGSLQRPETTGLAEFMPDLLRNEDQYRKGSVLRALEIEPPFDNYLFIEKSTEKCGELHTLAARVRSRNVTIINEDANTAILNWCRKLDERQRAVVFLDPFGASVKWEAIKALGQTRAVDLWVLFPYSAINRMLVRDRKPDPAWAKRLNDVFGTSEWETAFYTISSFPSLLDSTQSIESVHKSADYRQITRFFIQRLGEFKAVSRPLPLYNSKGSLLFMLLFAAGNERSTKTGHKIANSIIGQ